MRIKYNNIVLNYFKANISFVKKLLSTRHIGTDLYLVGNHILTNVNYKLYYV